MKHIHLISLLLLLSMGVLAQSKYELYNISGEVQYKARYGAEWAKANAHQEINISDSLSIPVGGEVVILRQDTKELFRSLSTGKMKMYDVVRAAKEQSSQTLQLAVNQFRENMSSKSDGTSYTMVGATTRSLEDKNIEDSILITIHSMAYSVLMDQLFASDELIASVVTSAEGMCFSIKNNYPHDLYINILCVDKQAKRAHLLYTDLKEESPFIFVPAGQILMMDMRHFVGLEELILIPFGTQNVYDTNLIAGEISYLDLTTPVTSLYTMVVIGQVIF